MINIVFDLDGTLADLYSVQGWEEKLNASDVSPYVTAKPMCDMTRLREELLSLTDVRIVVVSWGAKYSTEEYMSQVRKAKIEWLHRWKFPYDEVHIVKYGTNKRQTLQYKHYESYLFDDNEKIRTGFEKAEQCYAFSEKDIFKVLGALKSG